jgi:hypothetical protein
LEIKHLFDFAILLYRRRFTPMFLAMAMVQLPLSLVSIFLLLKFVGLSIEIQEMATTGMEPGYEWLVGQLDFGIVLAAFIVGGAFYQLLVMPLGTLTCARLATSALRGEDISFAEAFAFARSRYWQTQVALATFVLPLLGISVVVLLLVLAAQMAGSESAVIGLSIFGLVMILLGSLATAVMYFGFFPALAGLLQAAEDPPPGGILSQGVWYLKRSWALTRRHFWRCLGLILLLAIAINLVSRGLGESINYLVTIIYEIAQGTSGEDMVNNMLFGQPDMVPMGIAMALASVIALIFPPYVQAYQLLLYYDLRCRQEGYDLRLLLGSAQPPPDVDSIKAQPAGTAATGS